MGIQRRERYRTDRRGRRKKIGDSYQVRYRGKNLGTYHRKSDADSVLTQAKADFRATGRVKTFREITLGDLIAQHIVALKGKRLKSNTIRGYQNYLRHLTDCIGEGRAVSSITHEEMELFVAHLTSDRKLAPRTVNATVQAIAQMFDAARRWGYLSDNVARQVTNLPKRRGLREVKVLSVEQHMSLVEAINPHYRLLVEAWPFVASRPSEMFGLKVRDFDPEARTLRIERQYKEGQYFGLKHDAMPRTIYLDERTAGLLEQQIVSLGEVAPPDSPLFTSEQGKPINISWFYRGVYAKALVSAGLSSDVTPHTLRHCGATWLLEAGTSLMFTAKHLGHSDPSITASTYSHLLADVDKKALSRLNRWYEGMVEISEAAKPVRNTDEVDSELDASAAAEAERLMEELRDELVDELVQTARLKQYASLKTRVEELREHLDDGDVNAILAKASEAGVAVGHDAKMTHTAGRKEK